MKTDQSGRFVPVWQKRTYFDIMKHTMAAYPCQAYEKPPERKCFRR